MPPRSGTAPMITDFTAEWVFELGPATRAVTALASTPRVQARALHSERGGASTTDRRHPAHIRESASATLRWPSGDWAFSPADMACTETSKRLKRICRRVLYSVRNICAASRTPISCINDQPPPFSAGASAASGVWVGTAPLACAASATLARHSANGPSAGGSAAPASRARSAIRPRARPRLSEPTAEAMPSRLSAGRSTQPPTSSAGPASAARSKPRPACIRAVSTSEATSEIKARLQKLLSAGAFKPVGST
mmetsp:Transcript_21007/g.62866  ORF Transcript_21007/g.62866 Transcript_21007/m.62866 type:complete len:253 (-) Transcript_21007:499-1257(-)